MVILSSLAKFKQSGLQNISLFFPSFFSVIIKVKFQMYAECVCMNELICVQVYCDYDGMAGLILVAMCVSILC